MSDSTQWHKHKGGEWHRCRYSPTEKKQILMARKEQEEVYRTADRDIFSIDNFRETAVLGIPLTEANLK